MLVSESLTDKELRYFQYAHRVIGYISLMLILIVYHFTYLQSQYQIYLPIVLGAALLFIPHIIKKVEPQNQANVLAIVDILAISLFLSAIHLSLVLSLFVIFGLFMTLIYTKIQSFILLLGFLLGTIFFYLSSILLFGNHDYFATTSAELTVLGFLCLVGYCGMLNLYQIRKMNLIEHDKKKYYQQWNESIKVSNFLSRYVPYQLWQLIRDSKLEAKVTYKRRKITVFFSDIQGFTELSENLIAEDLAFVLNEYLEHMTEIAKKYDGIVDKFMGDAILIFFDDLDASESNENLTKNAQKCLDMAIEMRQQMNILRKRWTALGYPPLHIRMGISTGNCHVGNYGATHRMAYTILGHDVNLAARLQSAAEVDEILLSESTYKLVQNYYLCAPKKPLRLKGVAGLVRTWQVVEKYKADKIEYQRWFDYEYKGFHLLLNLEEVQRFEYAELIEVLEKMIQRIQIQQQYTNSQGVVKLNLQDQIICDEN